MEEDYLTLYEKKEPETLDELEQEIKEDQQIRQQRTTLEDLQQLEEQTIATLIQIQQKIKQQQEQQKNETQ